jgi:protein-arginine kinase activator protein McsA
VNCQTCGQRPVERRIDADLAGQKHGLALCGTCADRLGLNPPSPELPLALSDLLRGWLLGPADRERELRSCPSCATSFATVRRSGRVGCMRCFEVFGPDIRRLLGRLGGSPRHSGHLPERLDYWRQVLASAQSAGQAAASPGQNPSAPGPSGLATPADAPSAVPKPTAVPEAIRAILGASLLPAEAWRAQALDNDPLCFARGLVMYRNAMDQAFPHRLGKTEAMRLLAAAERFFRSGDSAGGAGDWLAEPGEGPLQRRFRSASGDLGCELNGTDHFRLWLRGFGADWTAAYRRLHQVEGALERRVPVAVNLEWGHLSASLANLGTALRAEAWLHLPSLAGADTLPPSLALADGLGLEAGPLPGVWRLVNRRTLGWSENAIFEKLAASTRLLLHYEQELAIKARRANTGDGDDRAWRTWGVLRFARSLDRAELTAGLACLREGLHAACFDGSGADGGPTHWQINALLSCLASVQAADSSALAAMVREIVAPQRA